MNSAPLKICALENLFVQCLWSVQLVAHDGCKFITAFGGRGGALHVYREFNRVERVGGCPLIRIQIYRVFIFSTRALFYLVRNHHFGHNDTVAIKYILSEFTRVQPCDKKVLRFDCVISNIYLYIIILLSKIQP